MKKISLLILLAIVLGNAAYAQVGFGNPAPDPTSILDLTANDKGLLIPRMTQAQRDALALNNPGRSLLVFDTTLGMFFFYDGGNWYSLNEWVRLAGSSSVSLNGSVSITGTMTASNYSLNSNGNGPIPAGGIIMWSGSIAAIPNGWALCNGTNGTPNLQDRFIVGAGSAYGVGTPGGQNMVTLTTNELPSHTHGMVSAGSHSHTVTGQRGGDNNDHSNTTTVGAGDKGVTETAFNFDHGTSTNGAHTHIINATGLGQPFDNRPLYFALAFIMKLP